MPMQKKPLRQIEAMRNPMAAALAKPGNQPRVVPAVKGKGTTYRRQVKHRVEEVE